MLKASSERDGFPSNWSRSCNSCQVSPCTVYCHTDSAYLCKSCDECIHAANPLALHHERVWVCSACESAPATITCHADAANLCINCDTEIHLANPLARRHNRVPVSPPPAIVSTSSAYVVKPQADLPGTETEALTNKDIEELDADEADSWLLLDLDDNDNQTISGFTYGEDVDENLDLIELSSCAAYQFQDQSDQPRLSSVHEADNGSDSVVPVRPFESKDQENHHKQQNIFADSGCEASKAAFTTSTSSSRKVPLNSGYLLTTSNIPNPYARFPSWPNDILPGSSLLMPLQFSTTYREARVLRYREKRKSRKFEKKIRYATRKANAETRPRVKGRFARKTDREFEVDQMFTTEDYVYGMVPSYRANKRMKLVDFF